MTATTEELTIRQRREQICERQQSIRNELRVLTEELRELAEECLHPETHIEGKTTICNDCDRILIG